MTNVVRPSMRVMAEGIAFPEGPVAEPDGSLLVGEQGRGRVLRVAQDGSTDVIAKTGGSPNGLAIGPDGDLYVCNNGGLALTYTAGAWTPSGLVPDHRGGWIQRIDVSTGSVEVVAETCDGQRLGAPNDLVFDQQGICWFTDILRGSVFALDPRTGDIREAIGGLALPNGIGSHRMASTCTSRRPSAASCSPPMSRRAVPRHSGRRSALTGSTHWPWNVVAASLSPASGRLRE